MLEKPKASCLTDLAAAKQYLDRIGARPTSLRRAVVEEQDGRYKRIVATVTFSEQGDVSVRHEGSGDDKAHLPTPDEAKDIKDQWVQVTWPEYRPAISLDRLPEELKRVNPDDLLIFRAMERDPGQLGKGEHPILMIEQRIVGKDAGKACIPLTFYDDGQWRRAAPPDALPLWGLEKIAGKTTAIIHEGAKAARDCERLLKQGDHPWQAQLSAPDTVHLGWAGGAPNPSQTDWSVLARAGIRKVIIVADNDDVGKEAVPKISKLLSAWEIEVWCIRFDGTFPAGFDLGDPMPMTKGQTQ